MSEIQDEAYTEACEEIDRLKAELALQRRLSDGDYNRLAKELERFKAEYLKLDDKYEHALRRIEDQQSLLVRAADALEISQWPGKKLIDELQEAAE